MCFTCSLRQFHPEWALHDSTLQDHPKNALDTKTLLTHIINYSPHVCHTLPLPTLCRQRSQGHRPPFRKLPLTYLIYIYIYIIFKTTTHRLKGISHVFAMGLCGINLLALNLTPGILMVKITTDHQHPPAPKKKHTPETHPPPTPEKTHTRNTPPPKKKPTTSQQEQNKNHTCPTNLP